jgi:cytochrome bd-type quinol oxidase subunit 1
VTMAGMLDVESASVQRAASRWSFGGPPHAPYLFDYHFVFVLFSFGLSRLVIFFLFLHVSSLSRRKQSG